MSNSYLKETFKLLEIAEKEKETHKIHLTRAYLNKIAMMVEKEAEF